MSAEYFKKEEIYDSSKYYEGYHAPKQSKTPEGSFFGIDEIQEIAVSSKKSQERLHEIEEQLEQAEDKCNKLKNQLDFMRKIYQHGDYRMKFSHSQKIEDDTNQKKLRKSGKDAIFPSVKSVPIGNSEFLSYMRQNSNAISTDTTGAAVKTINNILTGITDSVNRLSEFHPYIQEETTLLKATSSLKSVKDVGVGVDMPGKDLSPQAFPEKNNKILITEIATDRLPEIGKRKLSSLSIKSKKKKMSKTRTSKLKESSTSIFSNKFAPTTGQDNSTKRSLVKSRGVEEVGLKKTPPENKRAARKTKRLSRPSSKSKTSLESKTYLPSSNSKSQNLVELFHNISVNESDSEISIPSIKKSKERQSIPPLHIETNQGQLLEKYNQNVHNYQHGAENYIEPATPRASYNECSALKGYELPTIASKMKQTNKNYWKNFDISSIPFCPVSSTSPSHNIGLNIQQVMSIIKTRQPMSGLSPTLAHNIGLAAGKLNQTPLHSLMSTLSSRIGCGKAQCPLLKDAFNYQKLCELAKEIPDEMTTDIILDAGQGDAGTSPNAIFVPGNQRVQYPEACWTFDSNRNSRCTCMTQKAINYGNVYNLQKYNSAMTYNSLETSLAQKKKIHHPVSQPVWLYDQTKFNQLANSQRFSNVSQNQNLAIYNKQSVQEVKNHESDSTPGGALQGREKSLKVVLQNLHDEFEIMNREYDDLTEKIAKGEVDNVDDAKDQLEIMEKNLNNKEEEINIVMALYKEVLALKDQVKKLKQKSSNTTTVVSYCPPKIPGVRDQNAILHLTKLLKQIQTYQRYYYLRKI